MPACDRNVPPVDTPADLVTLFLAGDVMTGRGVDQIMRHPGAPELRETYVKSAAHYVELARRAHGPIPTAVEPAYVWGDGLALLKRFQPAASVVNLETSVTVSDEFWPDKEVHYRMHPRNIECLQAARIDVCALANNHVLDFGRPGLIETLDTLHRAGIGSAGAGRDLQDAQRPARVALPGGAAVWVFAVGSTSSGIPAAWAANSAPGIDLLPDLSANAAEQLIARVRRSKRAGDIAVASIHWGSNWGYEIAPAQVEFAHQLVRGGIDIVHGHSSHHVRPIEIYQGKLILYGCGDLVTDYEGIGGHEAWRGDLGAMYFATVSSRSGALVSLLIAPLQPKQLRLSRPSDDDRIWLTATLNRISAPFGAQFEQQPDGLLSWASFVEARNP